MSALAHTPQFPPNVKMFGYAEIRLFLPRQTTTLLKCVILVALRYISCGQRSYCQVDLCSQV